MLSLSGRDTYTQVTIAFVVDKKHSTTCYVDFGNAPIYQHYTSTSDSEDSGYLRRHEGLKSVFVIS